MPNDLIAICSEALAVAKRAVENLGEGGRGHVAKKHDGPVTKGDLEVSRALKQFFAESGLNANITSEENDVVQSSENPDYAIFFDELDGTFNYEKKGLFPSTTVISAFESSKDIRFNDALFSGVMDLKTGEYWLASRGKGCFYNGELVTPSKRTELNIKEDFCGSVLDLGPFARDHLDRYLEFMKSTWFRNVSCAGTHLAGVASGGIDVAVLPLQKGHEGGAGYLLVKEAGGVFIDFQGNDYGEREFDFSAKYEVIAAGTPELAEKVRTLIK